MSLVTLEDRKNALLKRRELTCLFRGQAGKLRRNDAVKLLGEELKLGNKLIVPIILRCETGKADVKGTFYVYDDENLARQHLPKYIFKRLTKEEEKAKGEEAKEAEPAAKEEKVAKAEVKEEEEKEAPAAKKEKTEEAEVKEVKERKKEPKKAPAAKAAEEEKGEVAKK